MVVVASSCVSPSAEVPETRTGARLPTPPRVHHPSHSVLPAETGRLAETEDCAGCHPAEAEQWGRSAHAYASFDNPWYRVSIDGLREEVEEKPSRHCAGCHDPMLLASGAIDVPVQPEDPRAHAGVPCLSCHAVVEAGSEGNGDYRIASLGPYVPEDVSRSDQVARHREEMALSVDRVALCGSCHRGFIDADAGSPSFLLGMDELGPWSGSPYAGQHASVLEEPVSERDCVDCHMAGERGHEMPGGHLGLASDLSRTSMYRDLLQEAATIDVAAVELSDGTRFVPAERAAIAPGDGVSVEVTVRNTGTGHHFPGGLRDTQATWLEVIVRDAEGRSLAHAGAGPDADDALQLRALVLDPEGRPELAHRAPRLVTPVYDHTIAPRMAFTARYRLVVPEDAVLPLVVEASLWHRKHDAVLANAACEATRLPRGEAFERHAVRPPLDPCGEQLAVRVSESRVTLAEASGDRVFQRAWEHALGLSSARQETLARALSTARVAAEAAETDRQRASASWLIAVIEGRRGRVDEALTAATEAERLLGAHPAIERARGRALAKVWRWSEAAEAFRRTAALAPGDTASWRDLAQALGSAGRSEAALEAAREGLKRLPRDEQLLRTQALALRALGHVDAEVAEEVWLAHRIPDEAGALRHRCELYEPSCHRDRQPVPEVELTSVPLGPRAVR